MVAMLGVDGCFWANYIKLPSKQEGISYLLIWIFFSDRWQMQVKYTNGTAYDSELFNMVGDL